MSLKFSSAQICQKMDMSNIDTFQATLLYRILTKEWIYVGTWIYQCMLQCMQKNEVELLFPHLVMSICWQSKVSMGRLGCVLQPS